MGAVEDLLLGPTDPEQTRFNLYGEVDQTMLERFVDPFTLAIEHQKKFRKPAPLTLYVQGPGGYVDCVQIILSLINVAEAAGLIVRTVAMGEVASASSMIAISGTAKHRYIAPYAEHLIHFGQAYGDGETPTEMERSIKRAQRHFKWIESVYADRCSIPDLKSHMQHDQFYITAKQAVRYRMADFLLNEFEL